MTGFRISVQSPPAGFYGDPYASYPTRLVDPSVAVGTGNVPGGASLTRTWGGVTQTYAVYSTIDYAATDYFVNAGVRLGLFGGVTYAAPLTNPIIGTFSGTLTSGSQVITGAVPANLLATDWVTSPSGFIPTGSSANSVSTGVSITIVLAVTGSTTETITYGGTSNPWISYPAISAGVLSASARRIIQGDPASGSLPIIDGSAMLGGNTAIIKPGNVNASPWSVFRKLEIKNNWGGTGIQLTANDSNALVEYCHIHDLTNSQQDNSAPIYADGAQSGLVVQYCKLHDVYSRMGLAANHAIQIYFGIGTVQFNEMYNAASGFYCKGAPTVSPFGWTVTNNIIHDMTFVGSPGAQGGILIGEQSNSDGANQNDVIAYNLFYNINNNGAWSVQNAGKTTQNTTASIYNNTVAQDALGLMRFDNYQGVSVYNNISLATGGVHVGGVGSSSSGKYQISLCDYNFYFTGSSHSNWADGINVSQTTVTNFSGGAAGTNWQTFHTDYPTQVLLTADPDAHGGQITTFTNGPGDTNFVDPSVRNYSLKPSSALKGTAQGGGDPGYNSAQCGPGW